MDLAAHFRVIAQNWLRILLISLGVAVLVFAVSTVQSKTYEAKTRLEVVPGNAATNGQTLADASTTSRRITPSTPTPPPSSARRSRRRG